MRLTNRINPTGWLRRILKNRTQHQGVDHGRLPDTGSFLNNQSGLSLVEVLIASVIIVVAAFGIYIGILYAESQINRNYHERVAALLASGECDWQYYSIMYRSDFDEFASRDVVINSYEGTGRPPLRGRMTMNIGEQVDVLFGRTMRYRTLTVQIAWNEPLAGERIIAVREDLFR